MKNISRLYFRLWRPAIIVLSLGLIAYLLFFHNLGHLLPGYDIREVRSYDTASNWHSILSNPLNAPYKVLILTAVALGHHHLLITRIVAASFGVLASLLFFVLARGWYGYRVALLATVMFASSSGFLHTARLGSALILQMSVMALMGALFWVRRYAHPVLAGYVLVGLFAVLCYIPGMIWFELLAIGLLHNSAKRLVQRTSWPQITGWIALGGVLLAPLVYASVKTPELLRALAGLPNHTISVHQMFSNLVNTVLSLGIHSPIDPELWVGHVPLLDIIELVLFMLGLYLLFKRYRSPRSLGIFSAGLLGIVLISLGGTVKIAVILPLIYLCVAAGLTVLFRQWLIVFPRNPIARFTGIGIVCVMVFFSVLYQWRSYYIAWPHNKAVRELFQQHQL